MTCIHKEVHILQTDGNTNHPLRVWTSSQLANSTTTLNYQCVLTKSTISFKKNMAIPVCNDLMHTALSPPPLPPPALMFPSLLFIYDMVQNIQTYCLGPCTLLQREEGSHQL